MPESITGCRIVYQGGQGEITEKKSRFIATIRPVATEEEAVSFVAEMKKKYWDARHNCSAFVIGEQQELTRCSDDGEPAQTAGRPMLDVLLNEGIHNACVVVTRYFGGVLLGTGGLVRAYQKAVQCGLAACTVVEKREGRELTISTDYTSYGRLQYLFAQNGLTVFNTEFAENVRITLLVPLSEIPSTERLITDSTSGHASLTWGDPVFYALSDSHDIILL